MTDKKPGKSRPEKQTQRQELERQAGLDKRLIDQSRRAIEQRSRDREFHGLEREFGYHQAAFTAAYDRSKDIKHPRDVGNAREEILRRFLRDSGYVPQRYAVSERSARVASPTGHLSNEIDILFYDPLDCMTLMRREDVYEVFPIESVFGVIQVKSRLNKAEIAQGLSNIASFKRLDRPDFDESGSVSTGKADRGFGLLFAYDSDLDWPDIVEEIQSFAKANPSRTWANAVFVLNQAIALHGDSNGAYFDNQGIEAIVDLVMHGFPDRGHNLFDFQSILLSLLRKTTVAPADLDRYFRLPLVADTHSYEFALGSFAEIARCEEHGDYQRKILPKDLERIVAWCHTAPPINWIRAKDLAYGQRGDNTQVYERQPGDVRIYNPDKLPLPEILTQESFLAGRQVRSLAFDIIQTAGMVVYIPYHYTVQEGIISGCPLCKRHQTKKSRTKV